MTTHRDPRFDEYLTQVRDALTGVDREECDRVVNDLAAHIDEEIGDRSHVSDDDVSRLLMRLGDPDEIAHFGRASIPDPVPQRRTATRRLATVALVLALAAAGAVTGEIVSTLPPTPPRLVQVPALPHGRVWAGYAIRTFEAAGFTVNVVTLGCSSDPTSYGRVVAISPFRSRVPVGTPIRLAVEPSRRCAP